MEQKLRENEEYIARKNAEMKNEQEHTLMKKLEVKEDGKPTILVLGGQSNKMYLLNRDRTGWSTLSLQLPTSLVTGGAVYLDGEIYIFGGYDLDKKTYKLNREMKWVQLADMNEKRNDINNSSIVFDGCIWACGGSNKPERMLPFHTVSESYENQLNSVEKYIPEENKWVQMPSMREQHVHAAAVVCTGKLFVCAGHNRTSYAISRMECFDPASQKWTTFHYLPSATCGHAMISDGFYLTVLGGCAEKKSVWKINTNEKLAPWKELPQMRESRRFLTANLLGGNIFVIGGDDWSKKVEVFNGETWEYGPELPETWKGGPGTLEEIYNKCSIVIPAHLAAALSSHQ